MTDFKIGDVVRLKSDEPDRLPLVIKHIEAEWAYCESKCLDRREWQKLSDMNPDPHADIKQAIREVLLSDEFMAAFAAAWMKTPLPLAMNFDSKDGERIQSLTDYPFGEPTKAQSLADRTLKAIWQANEPMNEGGKQ